MNRSTPFGLCLSADNLLDGSQNKTVGIQAMKCVTDTDSKMKMKSVKMFLAVCVNT